MTHVQKPQAYTCLRRFHVFVYYHYPDGTIRVFFCIESMSSRFKTCERVAWKILLLWIHATTVFVSYISCSKIQMISFSCFFFALQALLSPILFTIPNNTNHVFLHANLRMYCEMKRMITSRIKEWSWLFSFTLRRWIVHVLYAHKLYCCMHFDTFSYIILNSSFIWEFRYFIHRLISRWTRICNFINVDLYVHILND